MKSICECRESAVLQTRLSLVSPLELNGKNVGKSVYGESLVSLGHFLAAERRKNNSKSTTGSTFTISFQKYLQYIFNSCYTEIPKFYTHSSLLGLPLHWNTTTKSSGPQTFTSGLVQCTCMLCVVNIMHLATCGPQAIFIHVILIICRYDIIFNIAITSKICTITYIVKTPHNMPILQQSLSLCTAAIQHQQ